jgi:hypothetical protein
VRAAALRQLRSVPPPANSMAMNTSAPSSPTSCTVSTLGCSTLAMARASRSSRSRAAAASPRTDACSTLMATRRSSVGS